MQYQIVPQHVLKYTALAFITVVLLMAAMIQSVQAEADSDNPPSVTPTPTLEPTPVFGGAWPIPRTGDIFRFDDIAVDNQHNVYALVEVYNRSGAGSGGFVHKFSPDGTQLDTWGGDAGGVDEWLTVVDGIGIDAQDNLYIVEYDFAEIRKFSTSGQHKGNVAATGFFEDIAVAQDGTIYVIDNNNDEIEPQINKIDASGEIVDSWKIASLEAGIATDSEGYVYVADDQNNRIQKFTSSGILTGTFSGNGNGGILTRTVDFSGFSNPKDVAVDISGNIYVADTGNNQIQKLAPDGRLLTKWNVGGPIQDLAIDKRGIVYAPNPDNNHTLKYCPFIDPPIMDLEIRPSERGSFELGDALAEIILTWKPLPVTMFKHWLMPEYEIAFHNAPITKDNWDSVLKITEGTAANHKAGTTAGALPDPKATPRADQDNKHEVTVYHPTSQKLHYAIRVTDGQEDCLITPVSNTPTFFDTGFRPGTDGYSFVNRGSARFFPEEIMEEVFGTENVCTKTSASCILSEDARNWHRSLKHNLSRGLCYGMGITSIRFFLGKDQPSSFQLDAISTSDLEKSNARQNIYYHDIYTSLNPLFSYRKNLPLFGSAAKFIEALYDVQDSSILAVTSEKGKKGHAVVPYAVTEQDELETPKDNISFVYVYDPNTPDDVGRFVKVDGKHNEWEFRFDNGQIWIGNFSSANRLELLPVALHDSPPEYPLQNKKTQRNLQTGTAAKRIINTGLAHLLITNESGQRFGYIGETFVEEIPNAHALPTLDGFPTEPEYEVPDDGLYTIVVDGQTLTDTETSELFVFHPGAKISSILLKELKINPTSQDKITISADNTSITYESNENKDVTLSLADQRHRFEIQGVDIAATGSVTFGADLPQNRVLLSNTNVDGNTYTLHIRIDGVTFLYEDLTINAGDTHHINFGSWGDEDTMELCTDEGSDGSIDRCEIMENQFQEEVENANNQIYMPIIRL